MKADFLSINQTHTIDIKNKQLLVPMLQLKSNVGSGNSSSLNFMNIRNRRGSNERIMKNFQEMPDLSQMRYNGQPQKFITDQFKISALQKDNKALKLPNSVHRSASGNSMNELMKKTHHFNAKSIKDQSQVLNQISPLQPPKVPHGHHGKRPSTMVGCQQNDGILPAATINLVRKKNSILSKD